MALWNLKLLIQLIGYCLALLSSVQSNIIGVIGGFVIVLLTFDYNLQQIETKVQQMETKLDNLKKDVEFRSEFEEMKRKIQGLEKKNQRKK